MYWLARPPYLRWTAIVAVVAASLWADFGPRPIVDHPFARHDLEAGIQPRAGDLVWRSVPRGLLPPVDLPAVLTAPVAEGEPLLPGLFRPPEASVPEGWWLIEVEVPGPARPGVEVRLSLADPLSEEGGLAPGILIGPAGTSDTFSSGTPALVAVPGEWLPAVAAARRDGRLTVAVGG